MHTRAYKKPKKEISRKFKNLDTFGIYKKSLKNFAKKCCNTQICEYSYVFRRERQTFGSGKTAVSTLVN